jgi:preprotein translocase subunit SecD
MFGKERVTLIRASTFIFIVAAAAVAQFSQLLAQDTPRPAGLTGLHITKAERTIVEGKNGIDVTFDSLSAERLRQFTSDAVGRRMVVSVDQRRLATLRLLDPIVEGKILLTGNFDRLAREALLSTGAVLDLEIEQSEPSR